VNASGRWSQSQRVSTSLRRHVVASVALRGVRGKLRGSRAERGWQPPHVRAFHRPSQPIASAFQATMAWKRSGVRVP
jgi:hypothetical protein